MVLISGVDGWAALEPLTIVPIVKGSHPDVAAWGAGGLALAGGTGRTVEISCVTPPDPDPEWSFRSGTADDVCCDAPLDPIPDPPCLYNGNTVATWGGTGDDFHIAATMSATGITLCPGNGDVWAVVRAYGSTGPTSDFGEDENSDDVEIFIAGGAQAGTYTGTWQSGTPAFIQATLPGGTATIEFSDGAWRFLTNIGGGGGTEEEALAGAGDPRLSLVFAGSSIGARIITVKVPWP
jgi:hypothetical protein